jgi:hypothetical protein
MNCSEPWRSVNNCVLNFWKTVLHLDHGLLGWHHVVWQICGNVSEAVHSFETLAPIYQTTWYHIPKDFSPEPENDEHNHRVWYLRYNKSTLLLTHEKWNIEANKWTILWIYLLKFPPILFFSFISPEMYNSKLYFTYTLNNKDLQYSKPFMFITTSFTKFLNLWYFNECHTLHFHPLSLASLRLLTPRYGSPVYSHAGRNN